MAGSSHQIQLLSCDELEEYLLNNGIKSDACQILKGEVATVYSICIASYSR